MRDWNSDGVVVGRPTQSVLEASTTQKYPIGMIFDAFGKRYRYCRATAAITVPKRGCPTLIHNTWLASTATTAPQFGSDGSTATGVLGENHFIITFGADYDTVRPIDVMAGGILTLFYATGEIYEYRIIGNDVSYLATGADDTIKIYVDPPVALAATAVPVDGLPSPYNFVVASGSGTTQTSVICVPEIAVASGSYFWGQTRGPCWVTPNAGWNTANYRMCRWHTNGTILPALDSSGLAYQIAGYLLAESADADDAHIQLMLE